MVVKGHEAGANGREAGEGGLEVERNVAREVEEIVRGDALNPKADQGPMYFFRVWSRMQLFVAML